jgi:hypothetical protein
MIRGKEKDLILSGHKKGGNSDKTTKQDEEILII